MKKDFCDTSYMNYTSRGLARYGCIFLRWSKMWRTDIGRLVENVTNWWTHSKLLLTECCFLRIALLTCAIKALSSCSWKEVVIDLIKSRRGKWQLTANTCVHVPVYRLKLSGFLVPKQVRSEDQNFKHLTRGYNYGCGKPIRIKNLKKIYAC